MKLIERDPVVTVSAIKRKRLDLSYRLGLSSTVVLFILPSVSSGAVVEPPIIATPTAIGTGSMTEEFSNSRGISAYAHAWLAQSYLPLSIPPFRTSSLTLTAEQSGETNDLSSLLNAVALRKLLFSRDRVVRVLDDDRQLTVKLEKSGRVKLYGIRFPRRDSSNCPTTVGTTAYAKLQQLLPPGTAVWIRLVDSDTKPRPAVVAFPYPGSKRGAPRPSGSNTEPLYVMVQEILVQRGYARPSTRSVEDNTKNELTLGLERLPQMATDARIAHRGPVWSDCSSSSTRFPTMAEFEPLGGSLVSDSGKIPSNPGDTKGCSDFATYEDALRWYENYFPYYGDVARLDRDSDGLPCPGLAHTLDPEKYRVKQPSAVATSRMVR